MENQRAKLLLAISFLLGSMAFAGTTPLAPSKRSYGGYFGQMKILSLQGDPSFPEPNIVLVRIPSQALGEDSISNLPKSATGKVASSILFYFNGQNCKELSPKSKEVFCEGPVRNLQINFDNEKPKLLPSSVGSVGTLDIFQVTQVGASESRSFLSAKISIVVPELNEVLEVNIPNINTFSGQLF